MCSHERFTATVNVFRLDRFPGHVTVEMSVVCDECRQPVVFTCLPVGSSLIDATTDTTGTELRLPGCVGVSARLFLGADLTLADKEIS